MANQLAIIENKLTSPAASNQIAIALNLSPEDEKAVNKANKYIYGVLSTIKESVGGKNDLSTCNEDSIFATMIEAANRGVFIDGRQHAHLIKYGNKCTFQMGWRGYLAKIKEYYPDADFIVEPVYSGDEVKIWNENGMQQYTHKKSGAFRSGEKDFIGILFAVTYTDNGRVIQKVADIPKERIDRAKRAAKQDFIWKSDYVEKAKAAAIKNACKQLFASIQGLQDIVDYDNQNYDPNNQPATPVRKSIVDNINQTVKEEKPTTKAQETPQADEDVIEGDYATVEEEQPTQPVNEEYAKQLIADGEAAANRGWHAYKEWATGLPDDDKDIVRDRHAGWTEKAREITKAQQAQETPPQQEEPSAQQTVDEDAPPI